jgi:hypothetical protein
MLATVHQTSQPEPSHPLPNVAHITDIRYISSSVLERTRYPPQNRDMYFMSSGPSHPVHDISSTSSPLEDNNTYPLTVPPVTSQDPPYSHIFHYNKDILEELTTLDCPWNVLHHRELFLLEEAFHPPTQYSICANETKYFIPSGHIDKFNNPIPAPDDFEEGNIANISPTIKIEIPLNRES